MAKKPMSPALKRFLKVHGRFPKKGELKRSRGAKMAARKGSRRRSSRARSYGRRIYARARRSASKSRSIIGTATTAWGVWNGFGDPLYKVVKEHYTLRDAGILMLHRNAGIDGDALKGGQLKLNLGGLGQTWGPWGGYKVADTVNKRLVHVSTKVTKHWRIL